LSGAAVPLYSEDPGRAMASVFFLILGATAVAWLAVGRGARGRL
jgi:hypothetical protein